MKLTDEELKELRFYFDYQLEDGDGNLLTDPYTLGTLLHDLAWSKSRGGEEELRAAELLIKGGADLNVEDSAGYSPLFVAIGDFPALADLLKKYGAIMKSGPRSDDPWRYRGKQ